MAERHPGLLEALELLGQRRGRCRLGEVAIFPDKRGKEKRASTMQDYENIFVGPRSKSRNSPWHGALKPSHFQDRRLSTCMISAVLVLGETKAPPYPPVFGAPEADDSAGWQGLAVVAHTVHG